jgi:acetoin utilization protein AcuC
VVVPLGRALAPDAVVLQCGADALADDPLSRLGLSNRALWRVVEAVMELAPRVLVLGGGGYNPWSVARCWAGVWATLNRIGIPDSLPPDAVAVLSEITWSRAAGRNPPAHWSCTIADQPRFGPIRETVRAAAALVMHS